VKRVQPMRTAVKRGEQVVRTARAAPIAQGSRREIARAMKALEVRAVNAEERLRDAWLMIAGAIVAAPTHTERDGGAVHEVFIEDDLLTRLAAPENKWRIVRAEARAADGLSLRAGMVLRLEPMPVQETETMVDRAAPR
jgi:hypothetical protein